MHKYPTQNKSHKFKVLHSKFCRWLDTSLASVRFWGFSVNKRLNARGFAREFLRSGMLYQSGKSLKRRGRSSSLHSKKNFFAWGLRVFCEWHHKWRTFRPPWPILPGPGRQPLGGSISLKFLLETRLPVMESRDLVSFFEVSVSVSKVSGLVSVSVSKDFGLGLGLELLVSRLYIGYFYEVLKEGVPLKNGLRKWLFKI